MRLEVMRLWKTTLTVSVLLAGMATWGGCTPEQADAVLAGLQVTANQLDNNDDDVSFRDWLSSELDD